jgi:hypothetical protein
MKRAAIIFSVVTVLLFADGLWMVLANYRPGDANTFFGNQTWNISDGEVTLISAGFICLATLIMWGLVLRRGAAGRARRPAPGRTGGDRPQQPGSRSASRT